MPPFKSQELTYSFNLSIMVYFYNMQFKFKIFHFFEKFLIYITSFCSRFFSNLYITLLSKRLIYHQSLGGNPDLVKRLFCKYIIVRKNEKGSDLKKFRIIFF